MTETRHKCGDVREDGMVFWRYVKSRGNAECWVTAEKYKESKAADVSRKKTRYDTDPEYRAKEIARKRDRHRERYDNDPDYRARLLSNNYSRSRARYSEDPAYSARVRLRNRTREAFRRIASDKSASTQELLGTDWQTLKAHIESQFVDGMNWENMSDWHIDHIIPLASAKNEEELATLCHYTNLQPLWASDNLSKGAKLPHQLN